MSEKEKDFIYFNDRRFHAVAHEEKAWHIAAIFTITFEPFMNSPTIYLARFLHINISRPTLRRFSFCLGLIYVY